MALIYVKSGGGATGSGTYRGVWSASQTWAVGDRIVATNVISYRVMECTTGGAGGAGAEPTWNTGTGGTTTDNAATWTTRIPATWANATVDLTRAAANDAAGDTIWVSDNHAESTSAAAVTFAWAGSAADPIKILAGDDSAEPPTALSTAATVTTTGNRTITNGTGDTQYTYTYGITFVPGSGATGTASFASRGFAWYENCNFTIATTGGSSRIDLCVDNGGMATYKNCGFKFGSTSQSMQMVSFANNASIIGGSLLSGGSSPGTLFTSGVNADGTRLNVDGLDLTNASGSINLCTMGAARMLVQFRNCKLPAAWSGSLHSGTIVEGAVAEMFNCDSGDTNYRYRRAMQCGTIQDETTLVRTGGASDGTTGISWKLVSNANAEHPMLTLDTPEIVRWNDTTGSAITVTVEFLHDSATNLKDNEVWLDVQYLGTSGAPLSSFINDGISVVATAADQTDSSETWTTTGMANPNTQKLSVTFTPQEKGFIHATVRLAKASTTAYVDPVMTVT